MNVTATGTFSSEDTPITPSGSSMTWSQPVWASYGPWEPSSSANTSIYEQVPTTAGLPASNTPPTLTPNSMLPGTPTDSDTFATGVVPPDQLNGVWYSDAPMPPIPAGRDFSLQGTPTSNPFDGEHNGDILFPPVNGDYGAKGWWTMPVYSVSGSNFEHPEISSWVPTSVTNYATQPWTNNAGEGVETSE